MFNPALFWQERSSDSRFVASVWRGSTTALTARTVIADPCISIVFVSDNKGNRVVLEGPKTKPKHVLLQAGFTCTAIRLQPGVFLKGFTTLQLIGKPLTFPAGNDWRISFDGVPMQFAGYDHAEQFVEQLRSTGYLRYHELPEHAGIVGEFSRRTYSRLVQRITGLPPYKLYQLQRMHQVLRLLKDGMSAVDVASELAFADQSHLVRASKRFLGRTPSQLTELPQTP